jgi:hypothetical protein
MDMENYGQGVLRAEFFVGKGKFQVEERRKLLGDIMVFGWSFVVVWSSVFDIL